MVPKGQMSGKPTATSAITLLGMALALVPTVVFALLILAAKLSLWVAFLAWAACSAAEILFAVLLWRDISAVTRLLRILRIAPETILPPRIFLIPGLNDLKAEALRLVQTESLLYAQNQTSLSEDKALAERLPDPLIKVNFEGQIVWRNESAIAAFGNETAALMRHPDLRAALKDAFSGSKPIRHELVLSTPVSRYLEVALIPVGRQLYMLISDRTRERALEKMRADFVANSSHELRTPLASLVGFIETLRGPAADDKEAQQHFLGIMAEQAARMQRLIGDLLSLSKVEISEHSPPTELLSIAPLLQRIIAGMAPLLQAQDVDLVMDIPADLPDIPADADQLVQIFTNLLDNAVKYGRPGGEIKLCASAAPNSMFPSGGIAISVTDQGGGIQRNHIPRLTERFYRVDKGRSRTIGGTGLGLAIVKHVVNRHRGRLMIESEPGQGSTFTVWLPGPSR